MVSPGTVAHPPAAKADRMAVGTVTSLTSTVVTRAAAVVNSIIVIRALGVNDVGVFAIIGLILAVASMTSTAGTPSAVVKFIAEPTHDESRDFGRLLGASLVLTAVATVGTVVVLVIIAPNLADSVYRDPRMYGLILVGLVGGVIGALSSPFFSMFQGLERIKEMNIREMAVSLASVIVTYLLVQTYAILGAVLVGVAMAVTAIAIKGPLLRRIWDRYDIRVSIPRDRQSYKQIMNFAFPALASAFLISPILWFTSSLLATDWSFVELGEYSAAFGLAGYVLLISSAIGVPMVPLVSRLSKENSTLVADFLLKTFRITTFLTLPPAIVLIAYPAPFVRLVYGSQYTGAAALVPYLGPAMVLASLSGVVGYGIAGLGRMWDGFSLNLLWAIVVVLLSVWLVPTNGAEGLAAAFLGAYSVHFVGALVYLRSRWSISARALSAPLALVFIATLGAILAYQLPRPWNLIAAFGEAAAVVAAELLVMSSRERDVVLQPLRVVKAWIGRSQ